MRRSSSRKGIRLNPTDNSEHGLQEFAHDLTKTALEAYQKTKKKRGPFAMTMMAIYRNLRLYSRAVDVLVQSYPAIACLVWGSVRFLLQVLLG